MNKTDSILRRVSRFAPVKRFISGIIFIMLGLSLYGQTTYPVQVFTQLTPPYTPYLPAYYSGINQKLKVTLINTDMKQPLLSVFLRMKIKSSSFTIETPENVYTERFELQAGVPMQLSLNDLTSYFKNENMRISGGRNEFLRTNMLPDNFYRFNFEVYEANTGRLLSNPKLGFAQAMIASGEPPVLNLPLKGTTIMESNIPAIMFSWTPRHMNSVASAYGTEYEFTLVEIYDKQIAPEAAFDFSRVLYTETVRSTSFIHTVAQPQLIPGLRYAWRVRAVAREGVEEANVFKNNGFSPVFWFDYTVDCKPVQFDKVEVKDRVAIISWQQSDAVGYDVQYRKKGSNKWYTGALEDNETCPVYNLKFGEEYEYRIGVCCTMNDAFTYSQPKGFSMPEELAKSTNCGILPNINVSNQTPARELQAKLPILVGDFPVFITKVSGSGRFTGEGYIGIPYLKNAKIAITFKNIIVNTDNRMIAGFIETKYDISSGKNLLWDVDETLTGGKGVGDIRTGEEKAQYIVDYTIDSKLTQVPVKKDTSKDEIREGETSEITSEENERYIVTLTDDKGNKQEQVVDKFPATIEDKSGAIYEVDKEGNIRQVSSKSDIKLDDNTKYKQDTTVVAVRFEKTDNTRYALDVYTDIYSKVTEYEREYIVSETEPIRASAKLMLPGTSDEIFVKAIPQPEKDSQQKFDPTKVHFVTESQTEYKAEYDSQKGGWTLNPVAPPANDGQLVYVVYDKGNGQYGTLAILKVLTYEPKEVNVMLVPVNKKEGTHGIDEAAIEREVNAIYNNFGVTVNIKVSDKEFEYTPLDGSTFQVDGTGLFETRTADMKTLEDAFMATGEYKDQTVYLFVMDKPSNVPDTKGDMPRDSKMGYLFPSYDAHTIAHEIGHGVFNLKHPFAKGILTNQFNKGELKDNLMDYPIGNGLAKLQWDALHSPGIVIGLFEKDRDAMFAGGYALTPDYRLISVPSSHIVSVIDVSSQYRNTGTLPGFAIEKGYNEYIYYKWNGTQYVNIDNEKEIYQIQYITKPDDKRTLYLFYNLQEGYGSKSYIETTYTEELGNIISNPDKDKLTTEITSFIGRLIPSKGKLLPSLESLSETDNQVWAEINLKLDCSASDVQAALATTLEKVNKINSQTSPEEVNKILKDNYSPCLFVSIPVQKRMEILDILLEKNVDDEQWEFSSGVLSLGDNFFLDDLILSTPEHDRMNLLKDGFMKNNYKWIETLFNNSKGMMLANNDITMSEIVPLFRGLSSWITAYWSQLDISITKSQISDIGFDGFNTYEYPTASVNPILLGKSEDNLSYDLGDGYDTSLKDSYISATNGYINFFIRNYKTIGGELRFEQEGSIGRYDHLDTIRLSVTPFEPVIMKAARSYPFLDISADKDGIEIPAFLAAAYQQMIIDNGKNESLQSLGNGIAITVAVLAIPETAGGSLTACIAVIGGAVAGTDEAIRAEYNGMSFEEAQKYEEYYNAWQTFYGAYAVLEFGTGTYTLGNSLSKINFVKATKNFYSKMKSFSYRGTLLDTWNTIRGLRGAVNAGQTGNLLRKIVLGSDDMSQYAISFRKTLSIPNHRGNVAVFEYLDNNGNLVKKAFTTEVNNTLHSEEIAIEFFQKENIPNNNIKRIYSELEPCSLEDHMCKTNLDSKFPSAQKSYSYEYPGGNNATDDIIKIRRESVQKRADDLNKLLN